MRSNPHLNLIVAPAYAPFSIASQHVRPFGAVGRRLGIGDGDRLIAIEGRLLPVEGAARVAATSGPSVPVLLTLRRADGTTYRVRVVRSPSYGRDAFAGSALSVGPRRFASFVIDEASRIVGLIAAVIVVLRRARDPVAMTFCVAMLLNAFPSRRARRRRRGSAACSRSW